MTANMKSSNLAVEMIDRADAPYLTSEDFRLDRWRFFLSLFRLQLKTLDPLVDVNEKEEVEIPPL